jgi:hypothetical protein
MCSPKEAERMTGCLQSEDPLVLPPRITERKLFSIFADERYYTCLKKTTAGLFIGNNILPRDKGVAF